MDAFARRLIALTAVALFGGTASLGSAHEVPSHPAAAAPQPAVPAAGARSDSFTGETIDPLMRALALEIVASILREAASQPDPLDALGEAVERRAGAALSNPNTLRLADEALRRALQDAPVELREPLAQFASSVLRRLRRDLLEDMAPRRPYY